MSLATILIDPAAYQLSNIIIVYEVFWIIQDLDGYTQQTRVDITTVWMIDRQAACIAV